jgi:hypothetical protein
MGLAVWTQDEAGPYQTIPYAGHSWQPNGQASRYPHEYQRNGTAKLLTLFHPASGRLYAKGVRRCTHAVLHPWLRETLSAALEKAAPLTRTSDSPQRRQPWLAWQEGLTVKITLPKRLPKLRMLLVMDNLIGHQTPEWVLWLFSQGVMPLYTPLSGSWLNIAESVQRIIHRRALAGQHPQTPEQIIELLEGAVQGWNQHPTPFEWGGKRQARRQRSRQRRYALGGSGACTHRPIRRPSLAEKILL